MNPIPQALCSGLGEAMSRLRDIHVRFLSFAWGEHTLSAFGDSRVGAITFDYDRDWVDSSKPVPGFCFLRHLHGAVSLDITGESPRLKGQLKVVGRDKGGRMRTVAWGTK